MKKSKWTAEIQNELNTNMTGTRAKLEKWKKRSIYRVPMCMSELHEKAYYPEVVSLGPYHHGKESLRSMEEHKHRALLHFLKRTGKPLESYINALTPVLQDLKEAYNELGSPWQQDHEAFAELMITDGAFMLEIMLTAKYIGSLRTNQTSTPMQGLESQPSVKGQAQSQNRNSLVDCMTIKHEYDGKDPIFSKHGMVYSVPYIKRDMLMLENQVPLLVLEKLVLVGSKGLKNEDSSNNIVLTIEDEDLLKEVKMIVMELILEFFDQPFSAYKIFKPTDECHHILDMYRKSKLRPPRTKESSAGDISSTHGGGDEILRSATELNEAGIQFEESNTRSLKDVQFKSNGVLKLPRIVVDDALESSYRNMMAFERFHLDAGSHITSFVFILDSIIDGPQDVSLLHSSGIIQNALGSDKAVAKLFNSMSTDVTLDPDSPLDQVHKAVNEYCQKRLPRWRASLMHNYFTHPWSVISVVAAIFLFALTIVQTVYSVLAFIYR